MVTTSPATMRPLARSSSRVGTSLGTTVEAVVSRTVSLAPTAKATTATSRTGGRPSVRAMINTPSTTIRVRSANTSRVRAW